MAVVEDVFKALGDPTRIRIVEMLAENGELCVCKIYEQLDMTQPAVSHHLAILKRAGLVNARKQGQWVHYSLCCSALSEIPFAFLCELIEKAETARSEGGCCGESDK